MLLSTSLRIYLVNIVVEQHNSKSLIFHCCPTHYGLIHEITCLTTYLIASSTRTRATHTRNTCIHTPPTSRRRPANSQLANPGAPSSDSTPTFPRPAMRVGFRQPPAPPPARGRANHPPELHPPVPASEHQYRPSGPTSPDSDGLADTATTHPTTKLLSTSTNDTSPQTPPAGAPDRVDETPRPRAPRSTEPRRNPPQSKLQPPTNPRPPPNAGNPTTNPQRPPQRQTDPPQPLAHPASRIKRARPLAELDSRRRRPRRRRARTARGSSPARGPGSPQRHHLGPAPLTRRRARRSHTTPATAATNQQATPRMRRPPQQHPTTSENTPPKPTPAPRRGRANDTHPSCTSNQTANNHPAAQPHPRHRVRMLGLPRSGRARRSPSFATAGAPAGGRFRAFARLSNA